jgi:predicted lipoprotein with Yx(FWY)xxD motif
MKKSFSFFVIFGILAILLISGCTQQQPTGNKTPVQTPAGQPASEKPTVNLSAGNYIVDDKGKTLYYFTKDVKGESNCVGDCLNRWPVFYQEKISVSPGLNSSDFGTIIRNDEKKQTTFKGWPLYYFSDDVSPGDIKGEGVGNIWFIARPNLAAAVSAIPSPVATSSPAIKVASFPSSVHGDTIITIRWEVSGGTPGNISNTAILWGYKSGSENISDYSNASVMQTGKTLQQFSTEITIPSSGTIYFRAHAIVDGTDVFSQEYQISIIPQTSGY